MKMVTKFGFWGSGLRGWDFEVGGFRGLRLMRFRVLG